PFTVVKDKANKRAINVVISDNEPIVIYCRGLRPHGLWESQLVVAAVAPKPEPVRPKLWVDVIPDNRVVLIDSLREGSIPRLRRQDRRERRPSHHKRPLYGITRIFRRARITFQRITANRYTVVVSSIKTHPL